MMMIANLIGFCVGLDGIMDLLRGIVASYYGLSLVMVLIVGWAFVAAVFAALFIGVQVMFEIREDEKRRGINLRC
jgi:D-alanyl-lipoteichoic acid acyltransferase DltB (MBOAT superfamily)